MALARSALSTFAVLLACFARLSLEAVGFQDDPNIKAILLRTHSLEPPYLDSDMQSRWFDFGADTVVRTDRYIRLTPEKHSRTGWIFSRVPLTATNWEVTVEFKIHGANHLYGDGMAMWVTKQRAMSGPVFGSVDNFDGLGIFFDTYKNNRPGVIFPYISAMINDGTYRYDKENDGKTGEIAGCSARGIRNAAVPTKARLTYFQEKSLKLELQYKKEDEWTECFFLQDIKVPNVAYLGFSAETGELADNHDIIKVNTKNLYQPHGGTPPEPSAGSTGGKTSKGRPGAGKPASSGSWTWFFLKFIVFGLVLVGAYVGFTAYRARSSRSRF